MQEVGCVGCGEGLRVECKTGKRGCGHHCNHAWSHDRCCWCGATTFDDEVVSVRDALVAAIDALDTSYGMLCFDWAAERDRQPDVQNAQDYLWDARVAAETALAAADELPDCLPRDA